MNEIKEEFYRKFQDNGCHADYQEFKDEITVDEIWIWISQKLTEARMEQDCINQNHLLDKQDEIARLAKIDEAKYWRDFIFEPSDRDAITLLDFQNRITELEKEKK